MVNAEIYNAFIFKKYQEIRVAMFLVSTSSHCSSFYRKFFSLFTCFLFFIEFELDCNFKACRAFLLENSLHKTTFISSYIFIFSRICMML